MNNLRCCLVCKKKCKKDLCKNCSENPYKVEKYRRILAEEGELFLLKQTYIFSAPEIEDINSPEMWDERYQTISSFRNQDGMTKDRIQTAYKFLPRSCKKILDIGAGAGFLEEYLSKNKDLSIYANDFSILSVNMLKNNFIGNFERQSIYELKYSNNFFDCIFLLEVLEHIPQSRIFSVLKNVKSKLKRNGYLIISVPINEGLDRMKTNPSGHVREYSYALLKSELLMAGFDVLVSKELFAFNNFYKIKSLVSKIFKNRWRPNNIIIKARAV